MRIVLLAVLAVLSGCSFIHMEPNGSNRAYDPPRVSRPNFNQIERDAASGTHAADALGQCRSVTVTQPNGATAQCQTCCTGSNCNTSCY